MTTPETTGPARRRRRARAGEGMVTPRQPITLRDSYANEVLQPGRDRLAADHPLVAQYPEKFAVCDPKDVATRALMRELLTRTLRALEAPIRNRKQARPTSYVPLPHPKKTTSRPRWML